MASYDKAHQKKQQALFFPGPVDPKTGNFTPSEGDKAKVKQFPKTRTEADALRRFYAKHS